MFSLKQLVRPAFALDIDGGLSWEGYVEANQNKRTERAVLHDAKGIRNTTVCLL